MSQGKGRRKGRPQGKGSVPRVGQTHTSALTTEIALSTKNVPKRRPSLVVAPSLTRRSVVRARLKWKVGLMCVGIEVRGRGTGEAAR